LKRSYWAYSIGLAIAWVVILGAVGVRTDKSHLHTVFLVFCGFAIAWTSGTIARYIYPPPKKWNR